MKRNRTLFFMLAFTGLFTPLIGQVTIGSTIEPPKAALLNIQTQADNGSGITSDKGGLLLPRVVLENRNELKPFLTSTLTEVQKLVYKGMNVYHIGGNNIDAGQYVWDGSRWLRFLDTPRPLVSTYEILPIQAHINPVSVTSAAAFASPTAGAPIPVGSYNAASRQYEIKIKEDGVYLFSFRLRGDVNINAGYFSTKFIIYIAGYVNSQLRQCVEENNTSVRENIDTGENKTYNYSFSKLMMLRECKKDDVVFFRTGNYTPDNSYGGFTFFGGVYSPTITTSFLTYWRL